MYVATPAPAPPRGGSGMIMSKDVAVPVPNAAGTWYANQNYAQPLGCDPAADPAVLPEYASFRFQRDSLSSCGAVPSMRNISDIMRYKCEYFGKALDADGNLYAGGHKHPKVAGTLISCGSLDPDEIDQGTMHDVGLHALRKLDPTGCAALDPKQLYCQVFTAGSPSMFSLADSMTR